MADEYKKVDEKLIDSDEQDPDNTAVNFAANIGEPEAGVIRKKSGSTSDDEQDKKASTAGFNEGKKKIKPSADVSTEKQNVD